MEDSNEGQKLEPIPIETYRCPVCKNKLECSLEEAKEKVRIPIDSGLPVGSIYADKTLREDSSVRAFFLIYTLPEERLGTRHGRTQHEYMFFSRKPNQIDAGGFCSKVNSVDAKDQLRRGDIEPVRLEDLKKRFGDELKVLKWHLLDNKISLTVSDLIDPTPEIEALYKGE